MFSAAQPFTIVIAAIVNLIELRLDAYKFLFQSRRMRYRGANGIGSWRSIVVALSWTAAVVKDPAMPAHNGLGGRGASGGGVAGLSVSELQELRLAASRPLALPGGGTVPALTPSLGELVAYMPELLGMAEQQMQLVHMLCRKCAAVL